MGYDGGATQGRAPKEQDSALPRLTPSKHGRKSIIQAPSPQGRTAQPHRCPASALPLRTETLTGVQRSPGASVRRAGPCGDSPPPAALPYRPGSTLPFLLPPPSPSDKTSPTAATAPRPRPAVRRRRSRSRTPRAAPGAAGPPGGCSAGGRQARARAALRSRLTATAAPEPPAAQGLTGSVVRNAPRGARPDGSCSPGVGSAGRPGAGSAAGAEEGQKRSQAQGKALAATRIHRSLLTVIES